jgi:ketosteroid isomerase-like protein
MSQENVDTFREAVEALYRGDRDAWLSLSTPDHEVIPAAVWPEAGPIRGREAAWRFYEAITQTLDLGSPSDLEIESVGRDQILAHQHNVVRGRASGAQVDFDFWLLSSFRDGKLARDEWFTARAEALEAAGPQE